MYNKTIMKRTLLLASAILLFSCSSNKSDVRQAAYDYCFAMANYDVDRAEQYATKETREVTLIMARNLVKAVGKDYIASDTPASIEIQSVRIDNDTIAHATYHKVTPIKDFVDTLELRKRDGVWLAHALVPTVKHDQPNTDNSKSKIKTILPSQPNLK